MVSINDLRKLKRSAEDLLDEITEQQHVDVVARARAEAGEAKSRFKQSYVHAGAGEVLRVCGMLEADTSVACGNLKALAFGLARLLMGIGFWRGALEGVLDSLILLRLGGSCGQSGFF